MDDCFICLKETKRRQTDLRCLCKIYVHSNCWKDYTTYKGWEECPYCHTVVYNIEEEHRGIKIQIKIIKTIIIVILLVMIILSFSKSTDLDELP
jgi:hypothetical protein